MCANNVGDGKEAGIEYEDVPRRGVGSVCARGCRSRGRGRGRGWRWGWIGEVGRIGRGRERTDCCGGYEHGFIAVLS